MKKKLIVISVLCVLFATSCSGTYNSKGEKVKDEIATEIPTQEATQNNTDEVWQEGIKDSDLDKLVESFVFPPLSAANLNFDEDCSGFPLDLINQLKESLYLGESDSLIQELNDKSLMISVNDFKFKPNQSEDIEYNEQELNDAMRNGATDFFIYKCDTNGDGIDEIIMIQNLEYEYSYSNMAYLLEKSGDEYVYAGNDYLGYYRCFAICEKDNKYYLIANYDDYETKITKAVGVFALEGDNNIFNWDSERPYIYIRKESNSYQYNLLYENSIASIVSDIRKYIDDIDNDLIYTDRIHGCFLGEEVDRPDLNSEESDGNSDYSFYNLKAIDVDNDGEDEFFDRTITVFGSSNLGVTGFTWYDPKTKSVSLVPFDTFNSTNYLMTQQWFKVIDGKTVIFSLYRKHSEDNYLLDVRMNENGQTTILQDYMINVENNIELSDNWDYEEVNNEKKYYTEVNDKKAFPKDIDQRMNQFTKKVQGDFVAVNYNHKDIPNGLIVLAEKALFEHDFSQLHLNTSSYEISESDFYDTFGGDWHISKEEFESYVSHIYKYQLEKNTYYLEVADSGGSARFVDITIYKESDGELTAIDDLGSLDLDARVVEYKGDLFFIEKLYNYYSKYTDTINIYKLESEGIKDYVSIVLRPKEFEWEEIYHNHESYEKSISSYVESMKSDLMEKSSIDDSIEVYLGDETSQFDKDKKLRLKSVGGDYDYSEIDFNNDGELEYIDRRHWFPSNSSILYLQNSLFKFTETRIRSINGDFERKDSTLVQLWFKEIDGKVFTFRLFLRDGYNYYLNVSLVENTKVTHVQSYLIVPKCEFDISTQQDNGIGKG